MVCFLIWGCTFVWRRSSLCNSGPSSLFGLCRPLVVLLSRLLRFLGLPIPPFVFCVVHHRRRSFAAPLSSLIRSFAHRYQQQLRLSLTPSDLFRPFLGFCFASPIGCDNRSALLSSSFTVRMSFWGGHPSPFVGRQSFWFASTALISRC